MEQTQEMGRYEGIHLDNQLCFPLYACTKEIVRQYRKPLEKLKLTYTQYLVMMVLWEHGGMTEHQLGKRLQLNSGTLAPLLKRLENHGLICRTRPEQDERTLFLSLTEQGEALKEQAVAVPGEMRRRICLSDAEILQLKHLLEKTLGGLKSETMI